MPRLRDKFESLIEVIHSNPEGTPGFAFFADCDAGLGNFAEETRSPSGFDWPQRSPGWPDIPQ
jgi:hypothetical protein